MTYSGFFAAVAAAVVDVVGVVIKSNATKPDDKFCSVYTVQSKTIYFS